MSTPLKDAVKRMKEKRNAGVFTPERLPSLFSELQENLENSRTSFNEKVVEKLLAEIKEELKKSEYRGEKGATGKDSKVIGPKGEKGDIGATGAKGEKGDTGENGQDAMIDEDHIVRLIFKQIKTPKDGKDGADGKVSEKILRKLIREEMEEREGRVGKKKISVADISGLPRTLESLRSAKNLGGHGGTMQVIKTTLVSGNTYSLSRSVNWRELGVYVGGMRLFHENGDYSHPAGDHISQITLADQFQLQVVAGAALNVRGK